MTPLAWLLDLGLLMREQERIKAAQAAAGETPRPRPRQRTRPAARLRLSFGLVDRVHGPVVECHEIRPEDLPEWEATLGALEGVGCLQWSKVERTP